MENVPQGYSLLAWDYQKHDRCPPSHSVPTPMGNPDCFTVPYLVTILLPANFVSHDSSQRHGQIPLTSILMLHSLSARPVWHGFSRRTYTPIRGPTPATSRPVPQCMMSSWPSGGRLQVSHIPDRSRPTSLLIHIQPTLKSFAQPWSIPPVSAIQPIFRSMNRQTVQ